MADFVTARKQLATLRQAVVAAEADVAAKQARAAQSDADWRKLAASPGQQVAAATARSTSAAAASDVTAARQKLRVARTAVDTAIRTLAQPLTGDDAFSGLDPEVPLALFPVRVETRFAKAGTATELRIRIFPDDIHVDAHERELTSDEEAAGRQFWETLWRAGADSARRTAAWSALCDVYRPRRATWIARALTPANRTAAPQTAVAADAPLSPLPAFPAVTRRAGAWTRAARARALPDRFVAIGYIGSARQFTVWGNTIPDALAAGPEPGAAISTTAGTAPLDEGLRWAADFAEAERVGMAIRTPPLQGAAANGLDLLLVFGVRSSVTPAEAATQIESLFEAHRYTDGAEFLPQGFVTNNAEGASVTGSDGASLAALLREIDAPTPDANANSEATARALGVNATVFRRAAGSADTEQRDAAMMNTALWSATFGYYLTQVLDGAVGATTLEWVRAHFVDYVRARGPLPAWRVGSQPYGLLPVQWDGARTTSAPGSVEDAFGDLLTRLRGIWDAGVKNAPRMRPDARDADTMLLKLLTMQPVPAQFAVRAALGTGALDQLGYLLAGNNMTSWLGWAVDQDKAATLLKSLGVDGDPRVLDMVFTQGSAEWTAPLVESGIASETAPLAGNYVSWIATATLPALKAESHAFSKTSLLYLLLRFAVMRELASPLLPAESVTAKSAGAAARTRDPELFTGATNTTIWQQLASNAAATKLTLSAISLTPVFTGIGKFDGSRITALRDALTYLSARPASALERALIETLALASYRLDAWETSVATRRLTTLRGKKPAGLQIGAYGWVQDLKPQAADAPNYGFVHAPSVNQAATAAVLRNGWVAHGAGDNALATDLSSQRLRLAAWLLDGVRSGQPLGRLLGYRFERGLHEGHPGVELDRYIPIFRRLAPLKAQRQAVASTDPKAGSPITALASGDVTDGLALAKLWRSGGVVFSSDSGLPNPNAGPQRATFDAIVAELNALDAAVDAVSDALTAEAVHHLMQGDLPTAGAALDAATTGGHGLAELNMARTPRAGVSVTHRLLLFPGGGGSGVAWPRASVGARGVIEPTLEQWAGLQLGDPRLINLRAQFLAADGTVLNQMDLDASQLNISALDFLYLAPTDNGGRGTEWDERCAAVFLASPRRAALGVPATAAVRLVWDRPSDLPGVKSMSDALELARTLRSILTSARALDARDLAVPTDSVADGIDVTELTTRAARAETLFGAAFSGVKKLLPATADGVGTSPLADVRAALTALDAAGIAGCVPIAPVDDSAAARSALYAQVWTAWRACSTIETRSASLAETARAGFVTTAASVQHQVSRITNVLGEQFKVLPRQAAALADMPAQFRRSLALQQGNAVAASAWLQKAARVRVGAERWQRAIDLAEALARRPMMPVLVAQLPYAPGETWAGLPSASASARPTGGRVSLVAHGAGVATVFGAGAHGLVIDEWVEAIPSRTVVSGVAMHVNAPGAKAPQAVLLAVTPAAKPAWNLAVLEGTLREVLQRAARRAVDPALLDQVGQLLPAVLLPDTNADHTVSTDLARGVVSGGTP